ncbi:hypothetical protein [Methylococcus geothermalis]|uniref:Uncharacterized protein n=1 Tax=Methylococcus geothermalis TaxID=2681310 RepID=A0A858QA61_9GAMM|nr:hypothetical protein [Methylococcus geothermalis]QJD30713.1 hypothetical protein GNH96_12480 [Methylococcus geothermalis]
MAAFKRLAGLGRRFPFARELTLALLFKMIMLWGLWALFFRPDPDAPKPSRPAVLLSANPFSSPNQEALKP